MSSDPFFLQRCQQFPYMPSYRIEKFKRTPTNDIIVTIRDTLTGSMMVGLMVATWETPEKHQAAVGIRHGDDEDYTGYKLDMSERDAYTWSIVASFGRQLTV